jgi:hypothetical protein
MKRKAILVLGATVLPFGVGAAVATLSPAALNAEISSKGARVAASQLTDRQTDTILAHVSAGDAKWLEAAAKLRSGLDGAKAEAVDLAFSRALTANPAAVLRIVRTQRPFALPWICEDREIEPSSAEVAIFNSKAIAALKAISDRDLVVDRDQCIASIRNAGKQASR